MSFPSSTPGYHGRYLRLDLTADRAESIAMGEYSLRRYLGGSGLGVRLLLHEGHADCDPLSPEAPLALVFGPLAGSPVTTSSRFAVVSKSPLTERINDSLAGGGLARAGKQTGFDAIMLVGRATRPSLLIVDEGRAHLEPADGLWGLPSSEAEAAIKARLGTDFQIAVIGPAGERLVRYAALSHAGRHAGRGGSGAVLGSKNLKAIALRGSQPCHLARPGDVASLAAEWSQRSLGPAMAKYRELGTAANVLVFNRLGILPTRNFQQGSFDAAAGLAPESLDQSIRGTRRSCAACTIGCEHRYVRYGGNGVHAEYQSLFALGPLCGVDDPDAVLATIQLCDELGLDTISTGGTIALAMECAERGLLDADWLRFGESKAVLRAVGEVGRREGLGVLLGEGSRRLAHALGGESLAFAAQVKGMEMPGYEPRGLQTMALGLAVGARGADHNRSGAYDVDFSDRVDRRHGGPEVARLAIETEDRAIVMDSLVLCRFLRGIFRDFFAEASEMLRLVTGWDISAEELRAGARRIATPKKHFNILAGWQPCEDTLPERFLNNPLPGDPRAVLPRERLQAMIEAYNLGRGWTREGWPQKELAELGLGTLA